jgi:surface carbohydrate biosynthesis protein (TIGR04326 family)
MATRSVDKVLLESDNVKLAYVMNLWCKKNDLIFEWHKKDVPDVSKPDIKKIFYSLPHTAQAVIFLLRVIIRNWPLQKTGSIKTGDSNSQITLFSYLFNLDWESIKNKKFKTFYWTKLHEVIEENNVEAIWVHKYFKHNSVPDTRSAKKLIYSINHHNKPLQSHTTMSGPFGFHCLLHLTQDYFSLLIKAFRLRKYISDAFHDTKNQINFWPFFENEWKTSMYGKLAISNCLDLNLSEKIVNGLKQQSLGLYLQENQAWEVALIYAWKAAGHKQIIGVPHATIRFWDLRHFFDTRTYDRAMKNGRPIPDKVALNGPAALELYNSAGFPDDKIIEVEALRYLHLEKYNKNYEKKAGGIKRVLVLGDYSPLKTKQQMTLINNAVQLLQKDLLFICKPHPACPINPKDYPFLNIEMTNKPVDFLLDKCDMAYTSNHTSAAVDAHCAGLPVISFLDQNGLNLSPLLGRKGVFFVSNSEELLNALSMSTPCFLNSVRQNYFTLDNTLPRWKKLFFK